MQFWKRNLEGYLLGRRVKTGFVSQLKNKNQKNPKKQMCLNPSLILSALNVEGISQIAIANLQP